MKKLNINYDLLKTLSLGICLTVGLGLTGRIILDNIEKKNKCKIDYDHAHMYTSFNTLKMPINSCDKKLFYTKLDEVVEVNDDNRELIDFLSDKNLYKIEDNLEYLKNSINNQKDYTMYEYKSIYHDFFDGNKVKESLNWTRDENHKDLTGNIKDYNYVYRAYKVYKDNDNNYNVIESDLVDNIFDIMDEYPYVKGNYYTKIVTDRFDEGLIDLEKTK